MTEKELLEMYLAEERALIASYTVPGTGRPRQGLVIQMEEAQDRASLLRMMICRLDTHREES